MGKTIREMEVVLANLASCELDESSDDSLLNKFILESRKVLGVATSPEASIIGANLDAIPPRFKVELSPLEWQLYEKDVCRAASLAINKVSSEALEEAWVKVGEGQPFYEVVCETQDKIIKVMRKFRDFGATDSEPIRVLMDLVESRLSPEWSPSLSNHPKFR